MLFAWTVLWIFEHIVTMPSKIGPSSASASRAKSFLATAASASSGHAENQSIVVLLIRLGNWRMRSRYCSPSGDMHITTCMCFFTILTNWPYRFVLFTGVPAAVSIGVIFSKIGPRSFSSSRLGTSPLERMLLTFSRKISSTICVSTKRKTTCLSSYPANFNTVFRSSRHSSVR